MEWSTLVYKTTVLFKLLGLMGVGIIRGVVLVIGGLFSYIINYSHFLNSLLRLECIRVGVFCVIIHKIDMLDGELFYRVYFLVVVVCEGVVGLSLLVVMVFSRGRDYIKIRSRVVC